MLRVFMAIVAVAALAVPAAGYGTDWDFPVSGTDADEDLIIELTLDCWIQIDWQDFDMVFDGVGDWYCTQLAHAGYIACPDPQGKFPTDAWAGDDYYTGGLGMYYESADGAVIFVRSNNLLSMNVHTNGDLYGDNFHETIPTWFTVCLSPFQIGGVALVGTVPVGGTTGHYLYDATGGDPATFGHGDDGVAGSFPPGYFNYPDQYPFPCEVDSQDWNTGSMEPYVEGTIKFLARVLRHGLDDRGDDYTTWLDVTFATP